MNSPLPELKECPFCGDNEGHQPTKSAGSEAWHVRCALCGASTGWRDSDNAAVSQWNERRPLPDDVGLDIIEKVARAIWKERNKHWIGGIARGGKKSGAFYPKWQDYLPAATCAIAAYTRPIPPITDEAVEVMRDIIDELEFYANEYNYDEPDIKLDRGKRAKAAITAWQEYQKGGK